MRVIVLLIIALGMCSLSSCAQEKAAGVPASDIELARELTQKMAGGDYASVESHFDATMRSAMPEDKLREVWGQITGQAGAFQSLTSTRTEQLQGHDIVYVNCQFAKGKLAIKWVFDGSAQVAGLFVVPASEPEAVKPAAYVKPGSFTEQDVTVGKGEWALPGVLSAPKGKGPFAAVVLVHGSGPNDQDETVGANKPFKDIAQGLASNGIAALRYDKRTKVHGAKMAGLKLTVKEETIDDALAAASLLRSTKGIDPKRVFVLGHSLGGMLAPRIAKADPKIAGLIILAGTTRPLPDVMIEQFDYLANLDGKVTEDEKKQLDSVRLEVAKINSPSLKTDASGTILGAPASYWMDLRSSLPTEVAKSLKLPMMILQGERDYQVTMVDYGNWRTALGTRKDVEFKSYPSLNHLFISGRGKPGPSEYEVAGHVDEAVIKDIAKWVKSPSRR